MNRFLRTGKAAAIVFVVLACAASYARGESKVDLSGYRPDCGVDVEHHDGRLSLQWPIAGGEVGRVTLDLRSGRPLIAEMAIAGKDVGERGPILTEVDPVAFLVVGERRLPPGQPPGMSVFNVFFDTPAKRPFQRHGSKFALGDVAVTSQGRRLAVTLSGLTIGPFRGAWRINLYPGSRLVHVEAVVSTSEDGRAILYDVGLASSTPPVGNAAWFDTEGVVQREPIASTPDRAVAVRHRTIVIEGEHGSAACFPPPHQYFYPRDVTDNQSTVWFGDGHRGLDPRFGFGVRQTEQGGGPWVPWFNAPPGTEQRLGTFYLLSGGKAEDALAETLRYTHGDRFSELPGYKTFTSHWHMAITMAAMAEKAGDGTRSTPEFVKMFKDMGVDAVHLAEFHGDGHPRDPGELRLKELAAMFDECRRLSDDDLLFLPGEEANVHLGVERPGAEAGHWLYLFPRPVFWTMNRDAGRPFEEEVVGYGKVYHVGDRREMLRLLKEENGLAWTAHARIKSSSWAPDGYRGEDFFRSDRWLGAAWKAMPADLSHDRLGRRALDLLDDMANWGDPKYVLGEVDVFKIDHAHELYGHMNVNYLRLDRMPKYGESWQPVLDALRGGRFFVTTGEVLIPEFTIDGQPGGGRLTPKADGPSAVEAKIQWTFPPAFAELVSGDGQRVHRQRIDLADAEAFGERTLKFTADLKGRTWARLEVWDVAHDGGFTQPVWLSPIDLRK
ncbi:hypothetical protein [Paludisphaera borealis]|nr:hypothetical protein [Paludisphaera borealis]